MKVNVTFADQIDEKVKRMHQTASRPMGVILRDVGVKSIRLVQAPDGKTEKVAIVPVPEAQGWRLPQSCVQAGISACVYMMRSFSITGMAITFDEGEMGQMAKYWEFVAIEPIQLAKDEVEVVVEPLAPVKAEAETK